MQQLVGCAIKAEDLSFHQIYPAQIAIREKLEPFAKLSPEVKNQARP
jgi:hypothetical protein